ncbi:MAG: hypothetical protein HY680_08730 [Chloroflexi bacterium]|nr:hypothetical protein [Chloroflexota bacterium]
MPFQGDMRPYTRKDVLAFPGFRPGVYGLFRDNAPVFIGASGDIKTRVLRHLANDNADITASGPNLWVAEPVTGGQAALDARQKQLVEEYQPVVR